VTLAVDTTYLVAAMSSKLYEWIEQTRPIESHTLAACRVY